MLNKIHIKIINEEISTFFDNYTDEEKTLNTLKDEKFQKKFICDFLLGKGDITQEVVDANIGGDYDDNEPSKLTLDYDIDFEYSSQKFTIGFSGNNIGIDVYSRFDGGRLGGTPDTDIEPQGEAYYTAINWDDINVSMFTLDGYEIDFIAFKKAPENIQELFIRENVENFISRNTLSTDRLKIDKNELTSYCKDVR